VRFWQEIGEHGGGEWFVALVGARSGGHARIEWDAHGSCENKMEKREKRRKKREEEKREEKRGREKEKKRREYLEK
jgi:hypothetical protein